MKLLSEDQKRYFLRRRAKHAARTHTSKIKAKLRRKGVGLERRYGITRDNRGRPVIDLRLPSTFSLRSNYGDVIEVINVIREQGVVGLAVGFILGFASKGVIDSLVNNIINPLVGVLYGGGGALAEKYWCLKEIGSSCTNKLGYGAFLNQLINFIVIAAVVYFVVKRLKLDKLDKKS